MKTPARNRFSPGFEGMEARQLATVGLAPAAGVHALALETYAVVGLKNTTGAAVKVEVIGTGFAPRSIELRASVPGRPAEPAVAVYVRTSSAASPAFVFKYDQNPGRTPKAETLTTITAFGTTQVAAGKHPVVGTAPVYSFRLTGGKISLG